MQQLNAEHWRLQQQLRRRRSKADRIFMALLAVSGVLASPAQWPGHIPAQLTSGHQSPDHLIR